jgi:hypothetical protein
LKLQVEYLRDGFHEQGLRQTGCTGDEDVSAREEREQDLLDDGALADDCFGQFGVDARATGDELFDGGALGFESVGDEDRRRGNAH